MRLRNRFLLAFYSAALVFLSVVAAGCQTTITIAGQAPDFSQEAQVSSYYDELGDGSGIWTFQNLEWDTIPFSTQVNNPLGITLSNNVFTIPPGTYIINARFPLLARWAEWYNATDNLSAVAMTDNNAGGVYGTFSIKGGSKQYLLRARHTNGLPVNITGTNASLYPVRISTITIMKVQ